MSFTEHDTSAEATSVRNSVHQYNRRFSSEPRTVSLKLLVFLFLTKFIKSLKLCSVFCCALCGSVPLFYFTLCYFFYSTLLYFILSFISFYFSLFYFNLFHFLLFYLLYFVLISCVVYGLLWCGLLYYVVVLCSLALSCVIFIPILPF